MNTGTKKQQLELTAWLAASAAPLRDSTTKQAMPPPPPALSRLTEQDAVQGQPSSLGHLW